MKMKMQMDTVHEIVLLLVPILELIGISQVSLLRRVVTVMIQTIEKIQQPYDISMKIQMDLVNEQVLHNVQNQQEDIIIFLLI